MKKILFLLMLLLFNIDVFSQSYLGWITKQVNFREGPSSEYKIIKSLPPGTQIFIVSIDSESDYYNIIDIESNKEGFVHKAFIKLGETVELNEGGIFTPDRTSTEYKPEIEIFNNTNITLTLKLNDEIFSFNANQKRTISLNPGIYNYRASAPGVIPNIGKEKIESNMVYSWQFYIVTR